MRDVHELRRAVLHDRTPLQQIHLNLTATPFNATTATPSDLSRHPVLRLISRRRKTDSTPGHRHPSDAHHRRDRRRQGV